MESWLRKYPKWAGPNQALALDIARLEWADIEAFDGKAEAALRQEDLSNVDGAKLNLTLQPYVKLLSFRYPVDDLLPRAQNDEDTVSPAILLERHHIGLRKTDVFLAVHRIDYSVYFRRLDQRNIRSYAPPLAGSLLPAIERLCKARF
jgi:hypothetical protein